MITSIYLGVEKLDLYKDDNIILKSSIAETEDVSKIFTDSTNNFSVPATDKNNRIFKHFYNANLVNGWDIFNKVNSIIELDGFIYKQGKVKLNSVVTKSNIPISYEIQYYGNLTSLKDIIKDDKLIDLDFIALNFEYNSTNVVNKLTTAISEDVIATTLTEKRLIYDSNASVENTDEIRNIADNGATAKTGLFWQDPMMSIKNIKIIEAIESKYNITFSRDFFGLTEFDELYILLNGKGTGNQIETQIVFDGIQDDATLENNRILLSTNLAFSETDYIEVDVISPVQNLKYTFTVKSNGVEIFKSVDKVNALKQPYILYKADFETFENLTFHILSDEGVYYEVFVVRATTAPVNYYESQKTISKLTGFFNVGNKIPDLTVLNYLKGIFQMFKCIAFLEDETIIVKTLQEYYSEGVVKEFTKYIDFSEIPISTGTIFNEINYKFKEPKSILAKEFFNNNNVNYGDLEYKIVDVNGNKVDGQTIDIKLPFENMVYEKLADISANNSVNFVYGYLADESLKPVNVLGHLHYVNRIGTTSAIKIRTGNSSVTTTSLINVPIHTLGITNPQFSTVFGEEFNEYNGALITKTLYSNHHKNYIENAFNQNKRLYQFKAKDLPVNQLLSLKLNDILLIKDQYYRINKYEINLITKEMSLECYNIKEI